MLAPAPSRRAVARTGLLALGAPLAVTTSYLLALLGAATRRPPAPPSLPAERLPRVVVLVPAHDEEAVVGDAVRALCASDYPAERFEVVVVADNCRDATAARARCAGATVLERDEPGRRGKGQAVAWGLDRLATERPDTEAVAMVDADCLAAPGLLRALATRLPAGDGAVQAAYVVANPQASTSSALRFAGFALRNVVRPRGKAALGLSCGLFGSGMAFSRSVLEREPWGAFSIVEDAEYHAQLVAAGLRVDFAPEAAVASAMPTSERLGTSQRARWEAGNAHVARTWAARLVGDGLRRRDPVRLHAGLELVVAPQSLVLLGGAALGTLGLLARSRAAVGTAGFVLAGQGVYVVGGLALVGAPPEVFRALLAGPALAVRRLVPVARATLGRGPGEWVRTPRAPGAS